MVNIDTARNSVPIFLRRVHCTVLVVLTRLPRLRCPPSLRADQLFATVPTQATQVEQLHIQMLLTTANRYTNRQSLCMTRQQKDFAFAAAMSRRQESLRRRTFTPSENVATGVNSTTDGDGDGSLRHFSFATSEDQDQAALTALSYAVSSEDNCDCITFPDVPDDDIDVGECSDDVFWDRVRVNFSDSSCFELGFPEGYMYYPYCEGEDSDQCALCTIELSMTLDDESSSFASTSSSEDFTTSNSVVDDTTSSQEGSFVASSSSSSQTTSNQPSEPSSSGHNLASSVNVETSAPPTVVTSDSTPVGSKIGRLLTFVMLTILVLQ